MYTYNAEMYIDTLDDDVVFLLSDSSFSLFFVRSPFSYVLSRFHMIAKIILVYKCSNGTALSEKNENKIHSHPKKSFIYKSSRFCYSSHTLCGMQSIVQTKYQKNYFYDTEIFCSLTLHLWYELRGVNTKNLQYFKGVVVGLIKRNFFLLSLLAIGGEESVSVNGWKKKKITKMKCVHWIVCCIFLVALLDSTDEDIIECKENIFNSEIWEFYKVEETSSKKESERIFSKHFL